MTNDAELRELDAIIDAATSTVMTINGRVQGSSALTPSIAPDTPGADRLARLRAREAELDATVAGNWPQSEHARKALEDTKTERDILAQQVALARATADRKAVDEMSAELAAAEERVRAARIVVEKIAAKNAPVTRRLADARKVRQAAEKHLEQAPRQARIAGREYQSEPVPVQLPKGDPRDIIKEERAALAKLKADFQKVQAAPGRYESERAKLPGLVKALAERGAPKISYTGTRLEIVWPMSAIGAAPVPGGNIPRAQDAAAIAAWRDPDAVLAALESDLAARYEGVTLTLDHEEKRQRLRDLEAEILAAERIECAAIWAALDAGHDVDFRPDTDPRAVLGIR